jgi:hypothetical protein
MGLRTGVCAFGFAALLTASGAAQGGGKLVTGNPTPGTEQPAPPNLADRMTVTGCLQLASKSGTAATDAIDGNAVVDSRFELTGAERRDNVPADTGGSANASAAMSRTYHLASIESQLSPFVDAVVEVSGEVLPRSSQPSQADTPTLQVEFVQKLAGTCPGSIRPSP